LRGQNINPPQLGDDLSSGWWTTFDGVSAIPL
jgi:hypothetical protein